MHRYFRFATTISLLALFSTAAAAKIAAWHDTGAMRNSYRSSSLSVVGPQVVMPDGREVALHGINVGGWLVTEAWMCGFADSGDTNETSGTGGISGRSALEDLEGRFGAVEGAALADIWQDHWITTTDLDQIRDGGFNLVRVPISYRTLQHADGSWILDAQGNIDFKRMDWVVREAASRGIYTIFDLHVWPEQRTDYEKIGRPDGTDIRQSMALLWTTIAAHYRGNGAVAAFDLINEFPGNWGVQQQLARAVKKGDPHRITVVEGFTFAEYLKLRQAGEFPNSIFSDHFYGTAPLTTAEIVTRLKQTADSPVPVYIGEFLAAEFEAATQAMTLARAGWSSWTYKTVDMGEWGAFNYYATIKTDIQHDTYQDIALKWSVALTAWQSPDQPVNHYVNGNRLVVAASDPPSILR